MGWVAAGADYEVSLDKGKVVCRNAKGTRLKSMPKALKEHDAVVGLRQLAEWLKRHEQTCRAEVERWMVRSLPVPAEVLGQVWVDDVWRANLTDIVIVPLGKDGKWQAGRAGLLRDAGGGKGLGVVDLDGESKRLDAQRVAIPHPVLLPDLAELREFATDLGVHQGTLQLFREVFHKPEGEAGQRAETRRFSGAKFKQLRHVQTRAMQHGYRVQGGMATLRVWEGGAPIAASVWIGEGDPGYETETGDLFFSDPEGGVLSFDVVPPVTWSEGMRLAATLHAGRVVEEEGQE
jgi:hypothetical protein